MLRFLFLCTGVSGYRWKPWGGGQVIILQLSQLYKYFPLDGVTWLPDYLRQFSLFAVFQFLIAIFYPKITYLKIRSSRPALIHCEFDTSLKYMQSFLSQKTNIKKKFKYLISLSAISSRSIHIITQNALSLHGLVDFYCIDTAQLDCSHLFPVKLERKWKSLILT